MAKYGQPSTFLLVGGRDLSGENTAITEEVSAVLERTDGFSDSWPEFKGTGVRMNEFTQKGFYDSDTDKNAAALDAKQQTTQVVCYGVEGVTAGQHFVGLDGSFAGKYRRSPKRNELVKIEADWSVSGKKSEGAIVQALSAQEGDWDTEADSIDRAADIHAPRIAITSSSEADPTVITTPIAHGLITGDIIVISGHTGSTPSINGERTVTAINALTFSLDGLEVTVAGTGGYFIRVTDAAGEAFLQVTALALDGSTNLIVKVRHSDDDSTFADLVSFTAVTVAPAAERKTVAAIINRYLAVEGTFTSPGSDPTATVFVGFARA